MDKYSIAMLVMTVFIFLPFVWVPPLLIFSYKARSRWLKNTSPQPLVVAVYNLLFAWAWPWWWSFWVKPFSRKVRRRYSFASICAGVGDKFPRNNMIYRYYWCWLDLVWLIMAVTIVALITASVMAVLPVIDLMGYDPFFIGPTVLMVYVSLHACFEEWAETFIDIEKTAQARFF